MPRAPLVNDRKELKTIFGSVIENSQREEELDYKKKLKTYIIESNIQNVNSESINGFFSIQNTSDPTLKILQARLNEKSLLNFYLDIDDKRFWKLHSFYDSKTTHHIIKKLVENNGSNLDYLWLASSLLEKYMGFGRNTGFGIKFQNKFNIKDDDEVMKDVSMRFWGGGAKEVITDLRENPRLKQGVSLSAIGLNYSVEEGFTKENISNFGRFTVMKGNSVDSHFNIIYKIKEDYSKKLALIESKYRFSMEKNKCGLKLSGTPIYIDFLKPLEDVGHFVDVLVSSKNPFRIFGVKQMENKDFIRVFGADLHTNDLVNMEITPNWMSIYLNSKSCGNVVTRLVTNIQTFLTSQIKLMGEDNERII